MVFDSLIGVNGVDNSQEINKARDAFNRVFFPRPSTVEDVFDSYIGLNGLDNKQEIENMKAAFNKVFTNQPKEVPITEAFEEL